MLQCGCRDGRCCLSQCVCTTSLCIHCPSFPLSFACPVSSPRKAWNNVAACTPQSSSAFLGRGFQNPKEPTLRWIRGFSNRDSRLYCSRLGGAKMLGWSLREMKPVTMIRKDSTVCTVLCTRASSQLYPAATLLAPCARLLGPARYIDARIRAID